MDGDESALLICGFMLGAFLLFSILGIFGVLDNKVNRLDLDKDLLARYHVLKYYPEYENCSIDYLEADEVACELGIDGARLFCGDIKNKDGMSILGNSADLIICFDKIEMKDIVDDILEEYR